MSVLRWLALILVFLLILGATTWAGYALWFTVPLGENLRLALAFGPAILAVLGGLALVLRLCRWLALSPWALSMLAVFAWWSTVNPSNDREWPPEVAHLPSMEIQGDQITLRNLRNFTYRSENDFDPHWEERRLDLRDLDSLDLVAVYWMGDAIAHTILSFGFAGEQIAISIEIRKEQGESYSSIAGLFRQYELTYVVADERDLIALRTTYRNPTEDVYLYRVDAPKANIRQLFLAYAEKINALNDRPEFYNTVTTNCTTNIVTHIRAFNENLPVSWKMLASGYFPELVYERGALDQTQSYAELRALSLVNSRAKEAGIVPDFSRRIRMGLPGMN